jgi:DNA-binding response OmpR family regulator
VLDLLLPDANGYQVIEGLRADPATVATPVIVMTGQTAAIYRRMSADLGVAHHLTKPFHPDTLIARLQSGFSPLAPSVEAGAGAAYAR